MNRRDYTAAVLSGLRHVTESEKELIRTELDGHMEDHMLALMERGYEQAEAEEKAADCMGDPAEVSRELQKCYAYGWLILNRILGVVLALLILIGGTELGGVVRTLYQNRQARVDPMSHMGESVRERVKQELDIEVDCGNSVLKFYAMGETEEGMLEVFYCIHSKKPLGYAAKNINVEYVLPDHPENGLRGGGGYFSNARVRYGNEHMEVPRGTESIIAVVTWRSEERRVELPVEWEVGA